jgi:hypothetical protein
MLKPMPDRRRRGGAAAGAVLRGRRWAMRAAASFLMCFVFAPFTGVIAQEPPRPPIEPGARVRVAHECRGIVLQCRRVQGTLVRVAGDSLLITSDGKPNTFLLHSLWKLEVSRGQESRVGNGAAVGFIAGVPAGVFVMLLPCVRTCPHPVTGSAGLGALIGGAVGIALGAGIRLAKKSDRWEEVPLDALRVSVLPRRGGGLGLGVALRF